MYVSPNLKSKKAVKDAIAAGQTITVYDPGMGFTPVPTNGTVYLEGPHYPQPHKWYGTGTVKDGVLVAIK